MLALDREFVIAKNALMVGNDEANDIIGAIPPVSTQHTSVRKFRR